MKKRCLSVLGVVALMVSVLVFGLGSVAQAEYPESPISLIITYEPGGASDFQARIVTMMASEAKYLGQPVVVINKPGAGGQVGWNWMVERAPKDGYTMLSYNVPHFIAQSIVYKTKYNLNTFEAIANWGADPAVLIVGKDSPFNTVQDLVDYAKANPGKVTVSGAGLYVGHHIAFLQIEKATGVKMTYIPEKGGVPALQSVIGAKVKAGINNLADAYRTKDQLKILAIADLQRNDFLPDVKTFKEMGIDVDDSSNNLRGVAFPKGVPEAVIKKCADVFPKMFSAPGTLEKMKESGSPVRVMNREETAKMWQERQTFLEDLLKGLKK